MSFGVKIAISVAAWFSVLIIAALIFGDVGALAIMGATTWMAFAYAFHIAFND